MPSYARKHQLRLSLAYHAFNRSNQRIPIFTTKQDYQWFIHLLREYITRFKLQIYHWVLMPNHYHLLFEIEDPFLVSKFFAGLARAYTHYHHNQYSSVGFLWQGRFKLQPVQKETYLIACGRYIERNPVAAKIVDNPAEYPYSSARFYCHGISDGITTPDPYYLGLAIDVQTRMSIYHKFLFNFSEVEEAKFEELEQPIGDAEFKQRLLKSHGRYLPRKVGKPKQTISL